MINRRSTNNFDAIRLLGASIILILHSSVFVPTPLFFLSEKSNVGFFTLYTFFSISGYLVTQSFLERNSVVIYTINRLLRIFPALICVVLFTIFVVGPLFTVIPFKAYFTSFATYRYLINISLMKLQFSLPGLFNGRVINAPIWTLIYEFAMYTVVALLGVAGLLSTKPVAITIQALLLCGAIFIANHYSTFNFSIAGFNVFVLANFYQYFSIGCMVYLFRDKIRFNVFILIALIVCWYFLSNTIYFQTAALVALSYLIFFIAFTPVRFGRFITRYGDFSFGLYLYAYLMQHIIVLLFKPTNILVMIFLSFLFTFPFAALSWFLIEKRAMRLKSTSFKKFMVNNLLLPVHQTLTNQLLMQVNNYPPLI